MGRSTFSPGFRLSSFDVAILVAGLLGAILLGVQFWWAGMLIGFVVLHFFLFCNVFRISRPSELVWAAVFVATAGLTVLTGFPGWVATAVIAIALSSFLIGRETKKPDYHGIYWKSWNPSLPSWWEARNTTPSGEQVEQGD